jgi:hypothetical protein
LKNEMGEYIIGFKMIKRENSILKFKIQTWKRVGVWSAKHNRYEDSLVFSSTYISIDINLLDWGYRERESCEWNNLEQNISCLLWRTQNKTIQYNTMKNIFSKKPNPKGSSSFNFSCFSLLFYHNSFNLTIA